ncbi:uncharacterized protein LOC114259096 [Camellia sinensis]|uniref:uncharacterized protein LOC114259096 n=1 Tax=Camellia sinensis TaxID=4442 RepID=UPI0010360E98|nr:uncharacterized protein LOC114259096 [Camellia sinensis]
MQAIESLSPQEIINFMRGTDVDLFIGEEDYTTYLQTYLMPPLTGVRDFTGRETDVPSSSRARAADTPSTSRARAPRDRARGIPHARQSFGWPDLPTELTALHRVRRGITRDVGLIRGDDHEAGVDHQLPRYSDRNISAPSSSREREREILVRGRGRHREPIVRDDDDETSDAETEEAGDQHTESSESRDDDAGSGSTSGDEAEPDSDAEDDDSDSSSASDSDSGTDGDSSAESAPPRKRTKRASRA